MLFALIACFVVTIAISFKTKHFLSSFFLSAVSGIGALLAVNLVSQATGVSIALNYITTTVSAFMGLPGVTAMVLSQLILK